MNKFFYKKGSGIIFLLIFGAVFLIILIGFISLITFRYNRAAQERASIESLHIAEAGINYYRWHLIKNPGDIQDGQTWCCASPPCSVCGPYEHDYYDPEGQKVGKFILEISAKQICGEILGIYVVSTGVTDKFPDIKRKIKVKFAATSIADFAYIINDNVWAGGDREIYGKYHSNGGIRMDGTHNSLVTSATNEWLCTASFGCYWWNCPSGCESSGNACKCPGIFGSGGPQDLWQYPVPPFDFTGITADLAKMKTLAQSQGKYYPPSDTINPSGKGYHIIFNPDGTFDIKIITSLTGVWAYNLDEGWHTSYEKIQQEVDYENNVNLPQGCALVFVEDDVWVEGTVKGKITVASANLVDPIKDTTAILNWNLDYTTLDGSDSLALIAEEDVLIPLYSPNNMTVRGVFVAQKGWFGRNYYPCWWYPADCIKNHLLIYGSIVSNGRVGTKWCCPSSGYEERDNYFDVKLAKDPPPLLPYVSPTLEFISWEEVR